MGNLAEVLIQPPALAKQQHVDLPSRLSLRLLDQRPKLGDQGRAQQLCIIDNQQQVDRAAGKHTLDTLLQRILLIEDGLGNQLFQDD